jgi:SAM-dependent methyltransferase
LAILFGVDARPDGEIDVFYTELAEWWPWISPVDDYREEADEYLRVLTAAHPAATTLLELGSGGGNNAYFLARRYTVTLTDLSPAMLAVSAALNPECEHVIGDMLTLDLGRQFDVVFAHDAVDYMASEADLAAAIATAHRHCRPGGVVLLVPDAVLERFEPGTDCGGSDRPDGGGIRFLEWSYRLDPEQPRSITQYVFVVREPDGSVRSFAETHVSGLFPTDTWVRLMSEQGFAVEVVVEQTQDARTPRLMFLGRRPG